MGTFNEPISLTRDTPGQQGVSILFIIKYTVAFTGLTLAVITPAFVTLALKIAAIAPASKETSLGIILGLGALVALIANPLAGRWSDRTRSRHGRRRPWMLGGMLAGAAAMTLVAFTDKLVVVCIAWCVAQFAFNATLATLMAVLPDQVPVHQRGQMSAMAGMSIYLAIFLGAGLVKLTGVTSAWMFLLPNVIAICSVFWFALTLVDDDSTNWAVVDASGWRDFASTFWLNPIRHPDVGWAWLSRFLMFLAFAFVMAYLVFYLIDGLKTAPEDVANQLLLTQLAMFAAAAPCTLLAGWVSDRLGRRKAFVLGAAIVGAAGFLTVLILPTLPGLFIGMAIASMGMGVYGAIDQAMVVDLLPDSETDAGKNMGVFNIANTVPQSLAPTLAPFILAIGSSGQNYSALFSVAAATALVGALAIWPVKGVR